MREFIIYVLQQILLLVHPLVGNGLVNKFPRRQIFGKQSVARLRNNRGTSVNILMATNTGNSKRTAVFVCDGWQPTSPGT
jgi:hypothetical protein